MDKLVINSFEEFEQYVGKELGTSDYIKVTQEQIDKFADATLDHQWIHVDAERAKTDSPYHSTIAHGYLNPFPVALSMESDYRGEQYQDAG